MTTALQILLDFDDEMMETRKMLERVPLDDAHRGYKPHAKSMPLDRLATHVAEIAGWTKVALDSQVFALQPGFTPLVAGSTEELLKIFDEGAASSKAGLTAATEEDMRKDWSFKFGEHVIYTKPRPRALRSFLNHMVHHRAQLGVYLRLNNIAIPGMYGPSADDPRMG